LLTIKNRVESLLARTLEFPTSTSGKNPFRLTERRTVTYNSKNPP